MIRVEVTDAPVRTALRQLQERMANMRPLMANIANLMLEAVEDNFEKETDPNTGRKWAELAESTKCQRAETGRNGRILQVSGSLAASISPSYGDDFASVGTNKIYAAVHQFGSRPYKIKPRNKKALAFGEIVVKSVNHPGVPARPFLGLNQQAKDDIVKTVAEYTIASIQS